MGKKREDKQKDLGRGGEGRRKSGTCTKKPSVKWGDVGPLSMI
jgi:hypothetical protein